jgi:hypothetical protein
MHIDNINLALQRVSLGFHDGDDDGGSRHASDCGMVWYGMVWYGTV